MKRQFKAAAVVSAAALLAIGASFTSMAASAAKSGTWVLEADGWYCLDKNGEAYTNEWCLSYGKEYFVGEDGLLVTNAWIEDDDYYYFVGSSGAKTVNDWRYVNPHHDLDADEEWYYFNAKGIMQTGKEVVNGKTYYFDTDGAMLTGWVEYDTSTKIAEEADAYVKTTTQSVTYCGEDGARLSDEWIETWAPGVDESEEEDYDQYWYYVGSTGALKTGKVNDIKGKTYLFNDQGQMLTGWVMAFESVDDVDTKYNNYKSINGETDYLATELASDSNVSFYFCGTSEQGYVKKDRWVKTWMPHQYAAEDADNTQYWYKLAKDGKVFVPNAASASNAKDVVFNNGSEGQLGYTLTSGYKLTFETIGNKTYAFDNNGCMWTDFVDVETASGSNAWDRYYFGSDGAMKTGNVVVKDADGDGYKFYFGEKDSATGVTFGYKKGVGVTGAANKYLYENGQLITFTDAKYAEVDMLGVHFIINSNGAIQTTGKDYKDGSDVVIAADGKKDWHNGQNAPRLKGSYPTALIP